jgi:hypothetical protein
MELLVEKADGFGLLELLKTLSDSVINRKASGLSTGIVA